MLQFPAHQAGRQNETSAWLASLPAPLCIHSLARLAPEIADEVAAAWDDVSATSNLLELLLVGEDAPNLPAEVTGELLRLYEYHARCRAGEAPDTTWELPASRLQSLSPTTAFHVSRR